MGFTDANGQYRATSTALLRLPLGSFYLIAGTALLAFADGASTVPGYALDNSESAGIRWNNDAAPGAITCSVLLPADRAPNTAMTLKVLASKSGATVGDVVTFTTTVFMTAVGVLTDADTNAGGTTSAMTPAAAAKTLQVVTQTIAAADIPTPSLTVPAELTLTIKPTAGTLGTDDVTVSAIWLEYTQAELAA